MSEIANKISGEGERDPPNAHLQESGQLTAGYAASKEMKDPELLISV